MSKFTLHDRWEVFKDGMVFRARMIVVILVTMVLFSQVQKLMLAYDISRGVQALVFMLFWMFSIFGYCGYSLYLAVVDGQKSAEDAE